MWRHRRLYLKSSISIVVVCLCIKPSRVCCVCPHITQPLTALCGSGLWQEIHQASDQSSGSSCRRLQTLRNYINLKRPRRCASSTKMVTLNGRKTSINVISVVQRRCWFHEANSQRLMLPEGLIKGQPGGGDVSRTRGW